jgi:hypothetical protein
MITLRKASFYNDAWHIAEMAIREGRKVVLQQEFRNAFPEVLAFITNLEQLSELKAKYDKVCLRVEKMD